MFRISMIAAALILSVFTAQTAVAQRLKPTLQNVRYGDHPRNVLDVFKAETETPAPVFIFFHGGGFVFGDKSAVQGRSIARQCVENGITVVSANYRLVIGGKAEPFPGPLHDGVRVVQFVRTKAKEWNIDPSRIVVSGESAGGLMAVWLAVHNDFADAKNADPVKQQSSRVSGVIGYAAQTTVDPDVILKNIGGKSSIYPAAPFILGVKNITEARQASFAPKLHEFSALTHVSPGDPPMHLRYKGTLASAPLPVSASTSKSIHHAKFGDLMLQRYKQAGVKAKIEVVCTDCPNRNAGELAFLKRVFAAAR